MNTCWDEAGAPNVGVLRVGAQDARVTWEMQGKTPRSTRVIGRLKMNETKGPWGWFHRG